MDPVQEVPARCLAFCTSFLLCGAFNVVLYWGLMRIADLVRPQLVDLLAAAQTGTAYLRGSGL